MSSVLTLEEIYVPIRSSLKRLPDLIHQILLTTNRQIQDVVGYFFSRNGKFLRPALVLTGAGIAHSMDVDTRIEFERNETRTLQLAAACEIFHAATLIHDDIIDSSKMRRGIPTLNVKWGPQTAVLVGDFFHDRAMGVIFQHGNEKIMPLFLKTAGEICDGEVQELNEKNNSGLSESEYLEIIRKKTASLLACSLQTGALIWGMNNEQLESLGLFGINFGMAFQIIDDYLDFMGKEQEFGKVLGGDLEEGVYTLPAIHLLGSSDRGRAMTLLKDTDNQKRFDGLLDLMKKNGSFEYTFGKAYEYTKKAQQALQALPRSPFRTSLEQLTDYVLERNR